MRDQLHLASISSLAICSAIAIFSQPAQAETAPPNAPRAPATQSGSGQDKDAQTGEIVITAEKHPERLATVPAAVTAITANNLNTAGVVSTRDLVGLIPNLSTSGSYGSSSFTIRGVNTGVDNSPTVGTQIDGVPIGPITIDSLGSSVLPQIDPSILSRVEVLRGPQGTLYAGSTLGGIVNYVTVDPDSASWRGNFYLEGSSTKDGAASGTARAMVTGPLVSDKLGIALSGFANQQSGFIDAPLATGSNYDFNHSYGARAALLWQVTPNFSLELSDIYSNVKSYNDVVVGGAGSKIVGPDLTFAEPVLPRFKSKYNIVFMRASASFDWGNVNYIGSFQHAKVDFVIPQPSEAALTGLVINVLPIFGGVPLPADAPIGVDGPETVNKTTHELRFSSPNTGRFQWIFGGFYSHENDDAANVVAMFAPDQSIPAGPSSGLLIFGLPTHLTELAGFGDLTFSVTPKLDVTGGIRVQQISQDFRQRFEGSDVDAYNTLFSLIGFDTTPGDTGLIKDKKTSETYLANVRYRFTPDTMAYVRFATGFRPGGPNPAGVGIPPSFGPDTTNNYELGLKSKLFSGRGYIDVTLFDVEWKDIQVLTVGPGGTGGEINGGRAYSRGVEASFNWRPVRGLTIDSWVTYDDAQLRDDIITGRGVVGLKGNRLPNVPKWSGSLNGEYEWQVGDGLKAFFGGNIHYQGSRDSVPKDSTATPTYRLPSYTIADLRAGVRFGKYEAALFVRNIGDERAQLSATVSGVPLVNIARPRTIGVSLSGHL